MNLKKTIKTIGLPLLATGALASTQVYANGDSNITNSGIGYGSDAGAVVVDGCLDKYGTSTISSVPLGEVIGRSSNIKEILKCDADGRPKDDALNRDLEGKSKITKNMNNKFLKLGTGDVLSNGCYDMNWYGYDSNVAGTSKAQNLTTEASFVVCSVDGTLVPYNLDNATDVYNTHVRNADMGENGKLGSTRAWYSYTPSDVKLCNLDDSCGTSDVDASVPKMSKTSNLNYILTTGAGGGELSTYPSLYSVVKDSEGKYSVSRGEGFSGKQYDFSEPSRFLTDKEGMADTVFERASLVLPENNIVAVTDAAYLQKLTGAKGNLEALVEGSSVFDRNVKLSCDKKSTECVSLEDFVSGVSYSAVHDRVGSDIAEFHMDSVANDSYESGYATTLRNGTLVNIILPGDDWILQQSTAYTGRILNGELHDNLADVADKCISSYDSNKTFGGFKAADTINCIYGGINKEIGTRNISGDNK
jgi:hypothetical protein